MTWQRRLYKIKKVKTRKRADSKEMKSRKIPTSLEFEMGEIQELNEDISECEIRVFYHGKNRNGSYITKATGEELAKSLPRAPIVAFYNEEKGDFEGHEEEMTLEGDKIKMVTKTVPYGAIDKDTPLKWETVIGENGEEREYMVAKGFLWTGRYPFLKKVVESSKGQSMELFEDSVIGTWANVPNEEHEFFIINEARISALCILGDDVEPCFEEADISAPGLNYSMQADEFKKDFDKFMLQLDTVLYEKDEEGGLSVKKEKFEDAGEDLKAAKSAVSKAEESKSQADVDAAKEKVSALPAGGDKDLLTERLGKIEVAKEDKAEDKKDSEDKFEEKVEVPEADKEEDVEPEVDLTEELFELQKSYEKLADELEVVSTAFAELAAEKEERETEEKQAIIEEFAALGEEVIKSFEEKIGDYSVEELEKELSVIAFREGFSFNLLKQEEHIVTPRVDKSQDAAPAWIKAIEKKQKSE